MSQQENKWTINDLLKNLKNNKDAVIVIGDKAVEELNLYAINEESKKMLNKKKMVREPKYFWKHYRENILPQKGTAKAEESILELLKTGVCKTVVDLNYTGNINKGLLTPTQVIQLKGDHSYYRCMSCGEEGIYTSEMVNTLSMLKCHCGGKIAPSVTMFGEKYLQKHTQAVKDAIFTEEDGKVTLNTHCLIFVGVDFEEDYMHELIESYSAIKSEVSTDEDPYFCVMISEKDGVSIEYYQPEFATFEDIPGALNRLIAQLKEA